MVLTYKQKSENLWANVEVLDLYEEKNIQPFLSFEDMKVLNDDPKRKLFQEKIKWADELVFVFPIWWGMIPAIMKNFIDSNFEAGFAFRFVKWKTIPLKLLEWKTAKIYATCDGPAIIYNNHIAPLYLEEFLKIYIFWVFWIKVTDFELYDKIRKKTKEQKEEILKKIENHLELENMSFGFKKMICKIVGTNKI